MKVLLKKNSQKETVKVKIVIGNAIYKIIQTNPEGLYISKEVGGRSSPVTIMPHSDNEFLIK